MCLGEGQYCWSDHHHHYHQDPQHHHLADCKRWRWWSVTKYWWSENANRSSSWFVLPGDKTVKWWKITALGQFCFHHNASWIVIWFPWKGYIKYIQTHNTRLYFVHKTIKSVFILGFDNRRQQTQTFTQGNAVVLLPKCQYIDFWRWTQYVSCGKIRMGWVRVWKWPLLHLDKNLKAFKEPD